MRPALPLAERLDAAPHRYDGLQAIRLAELGTLPRAGEEAAPALPIRIAAQPGLALASAPVSAIRAEPRARRIRSAFLGLTGPLGVLPQVYSEMVQAAGRLRNTAFPEFLDLFTHRLTGLFLQASEKYRLAILVQRSAVDWPASASPAAGSPAGQEVRGPMRIGSDPVSRAMLAIAGLGTPGLHGRLALPDEAILYYAGLFAARTRPAQSLQSMAADFLGLDVTIEQFSGRWIAIATEEQSRLPRAGEPPRYCALGVDAVAGERVWDVQSAFRVVVGPVDTAAMLDLMPDQPLLARLVDLVRVYAGADLLFDVQIILHRDCVPELTLDGSAGQSAPRLGWNTWAKGLPALEHKRDIILDPETVLRCRGNAGRGHAGRASRRATQQQTGRLDERAPLLDEGSSAGGAAAAGGLA